MHLVANSLVTVVWRLPAPWHALLDLPVSTLADLCWATNKRMPMLLGPADGYAALGQILVKLDM
eukprot:121545-Rhodomonas_salina.1